MPPFYHGTASKSIVLVKLTANVAPQPSDDEDRDIDQVDVRDVPQILGLGHPWRHRFGKVSKLPKDTVIWTKHQTHYVWCLVFCPLQHWNNPQQNAAHPQIKAMWRVRQEAPNID